MEEKLSEMVRKARESMALSQEEMAFEMGVPLSTYKRFENGRSKIVSDHLLNMARVTSMSVAEILAGGKISPGEGGMLRVDDNFAEKKKQLDLIHREELAEKDRIIAALLKTIADITGKTD